jgi:hypothetical protein
MKGASLAALVADSRAVGAIGWNQKTGPGIVAIVIVAGYQNPAFLVRDFKDWFKRGPKPLGPDFHQKHIAFFCSEKA